MVTSKSSNKAAAETSVRGKVAALLLDDHENAYQQLLAREARAAADELGLRLLDPLFAAGSSWGQLEALNGLLRSSDPPNGIMVLVAGDQYTPAPFERVARAGVSIVFLNRIPSWLQTFREQHPDTLITGVRPRQEGVGQLQAAQALHLLRNGGFVILVTGPVLSTTAVARKEGFLAAVGSSFDIQELDGRWTAEGAERALAQWFHISPERVPQLVVCHNDAMARGAHAALKREAARSGRSALERIPLLGCDGVEEEGRTQVTQKIQAATVVLPPTTRPALQVLVDYWQRGVRPAVMDVEVKSFPEVERISAAQRV